MKSKTIFKSTVKAFAKHCQEVAYISRSFKRTMGGAFCRGFFHLCGYDTWGNPIALVVETYNCPAYEAADQARKFAPTSEKVTDYLEAQGLEVVDGVFQFGDNFSTGVVGDLEPDPPVSTQDHNPLRGQEPGSKNLPEPNPPKSV